MPIRNYIIPPGIDLDLLRQQAQRRRAALVQAGCSTYTLGWRVAGPAIVCLCCGLGSGHPSDITQRYCGFCHEFHAEWREDTP